MDTFEISRLMMARPKERCKIIYDLTKILVLKSVTKPEMFKNVFKELGVVINGQSRRILN